MYNLSVPSEAMSIVLNLRIHKNIKKSLNNAKEPYFIYNVRQSSLDSQPQRQKNPKPETG